MPQAAAPEMRSNSALTVSGSRPQTDWCCRVHTGSAAVTASASSGSVAASFGSSAAGDGAPSPETGRHPVTDSAIASRSRHNTMRLIDVPPFMQGHYSKKDSGVQRTPEP